MGGLSTRRAEFGILEREALGPPRCAGEFIKERDVVDAFWRLAHHFVDLVSIRSDENAPAIGLDAVEDDGSGGMPSNWGSIAKNWSACRLRPQNVW